MHEDANLLPHVDQVVTRTDECCIRKLLVPLQEATTFLYLWNLWILQFSLFLSLYKSISSSTTLSLFSLSSDIFRSSEIQQPTWMAFT